MAVIAIAEISVIKKLSFQPRKIYIATKKVNDGGIIRKILIDKSLIEPVS